MAKNRRLNAHLLTTSLRNSKPANIKFYKIMITSNKNQAKTLNPNPKPNLKPINPKPFGSNKPKTLGLINPKPWV